LPNDEEHNMKAEASNVPVKNSNGAEENADEPNMDSEASSSGAAL